MVSCFLDPPTDLSKGGEYSFVSVLVVEDILISYPFILIPSHLILSAIPSLMKYNLREMLGWTSQSTGR